MAFGAQLYNMVGTLAIEPQTARGAQWANSSQGVETRCLEKVKPDHVLFLTGGEAEANLRSEGGQKWSEVGPTS